MPQNQCTARYKRETQIFREFVHVDGEKEYKRMITKIKEIACEFTDDVEKARVPTVLRSIAKRNGQHSEGEHLGKTPRADKIRTHTYK